MKKGSKKVGYIIFEIFMWLFALLFLFPGVFTLMNSFKTESEITLTPMSMPTKFSIENYIEAWKATNFLGVLSNTFIITVLSTFGIIVISAMAAYILARTKGKISWTVYLLFAFSMVVPFQTIMVPLIINAKEWGLKGDLGLFTCFINMLPVDLAANVTAAIEPMISSMPELIKGVLSVTGIIPIYLGVGCPLAIFMYHGFIKSIPIELEESASIDGASRLRTFFQIVFPLLAPITATIIILDVLWLWNDFLMPMIILPKQSTIQLAQYGFFSQFKKEYAKAMASLILSASPVVIFYILMQKYIIKGITSGAVKG